MCSNTFSLIGQYNKKHWWFLAGESRVSVIMMLLCLPTSMVTIKRVPKIWIYTYQDVQKNFVNVDSYIIAVCCGMTWPISWKNPAHLMYLKATIVPSLVDKSLSMYGCIYLSIYTFNPSLISILFLHFTEAPTCMHISNHDVCTLLSSFCTKGFFNMF